MNFETLVGASNCGNRWARPGRSFVLRGAVALFLTVGWLTITASQSHAAGQAQGASAQAASAKQLGTIKAISGSVITLVTDAGASITVQVDDGTRMVRTAPGQTDLKGATVIHIQDLQAGDRILVRGKASDDAKTIAATAVIAMKQSDLAAKQEQERQDWQKRGIGGLVSAVDPSSGTITISTGAGSTKKSVTIHTTAATVFRRYAPDSVKFDDAKASALDQVKSGDQLRARGNKNADGTEFAAEEVVSGLFRNIAGTIESLDVTANTVTVKDLLSKKSIVVRITSDSQVRKLPLQMAQMIAMRLKGGAANGGAPNGGAAAPQPASANGASPGGQSRPGGMGGNRPGGSPDFQQMLSRMPPAGLSDLQKGDAVMIVSTEGSDSGVVTAITFVAGVEPILQASPAGQMMTLSPWSLGGGGGGDDTSGGAPQ
jgi:hypothetical protein